MVKGDFIPLHCIPLNRISPHLSGTKKFCKDAIFLLQIKLRCRHSHAGIIDDLN